MFSFITSLPRKRYTLQYLGNVFPANSVAPRAEEKGTSQYSNTQNMDFIMFSTYLPTFWDQFFTFPRHTLNEIVGTKEVMTRRGEPSSRTSASFRLLVRVVLVDVREAPFGAFSYKFYLPKYLWHGSLWGSRYHYPVPLWVLDTSSRPEREQSRFQRLVDCTPLNSPMTPSSNTEQMSLV